MFTVRTNASYLRTDVFKLMYFNEKSLYHTSPYSMNMFYEVPSLHFRNVITFIKRQSLFPGYIIVTQCTFNKHQSLFCVYIRISSNAKHFKKASVLIWWVCSMYFKKRQSLFYGYIIAVMQLQSRTLVHIYIS